MTQINIMKYDTVSLDEASQSLVIVDQTQIPYNVEYLHLKTEAEIWKAIKLLQVRGAPAIGVAAAIGIYVIANQFESQDYASFKAEFERAKDYLASSRPTAVNLFWALDQMYQEVLKYEDLEPAQLKLKLKAKALLIHDEDIAMSRAIGEYGLSLIKNNDTILTHCNAGQLATTKYGTALAPLHLGRERGMNFKVFTDETRPLLQGARLSAFECVSNGMETTVICDNMAAQVLKNGWIDAIFVGADRIASNGDVCNKIGTSGLAILANYYKVPFYVLAPSSSFDFSLKTGAEIPIEIREDAEITEMWYRQRMAPQGVKVYNPAFDVTDQSLVTAIVCEEGILRPNYQESIAQLQERK